MPVEHSRSSLIVLGPASLSLVVSSIHVRASPSFTFLGLMGAVALLASGCQYVPKAENLVDCTNATMTVEMLVQHHPPYQFVLGLPRGTSNELHFAGQATGTVARIPITSRKITSCNWLHGYDGEILTWSRTNRGARLEEMIRRGENYEVNVVAVARQGNAF
jgi:hypothetical protein